MKFTYVLSAILLFVLYSTSYRSEGEFQASKFQLGVNFTAKSYCSCLFVTKNSNEDCLNYAGLDFISPKLSVNYSEKITQSVFFFFVKGKAQFLGEDKGCVLL